MPSLMIGCIVGTVVSILIGFSSLRLRGFGLAIATIAFSELVRIGFTNWSFVGGAIGIHKIPLVTNLPLVWGSVLLFFIILSRLQRSRLGRALEAIKEDEVAAEVMGIDSAKAKLFAIGLSGLLAGLSGVFIAHFFGSITPEHFGFPLLIQMFTIALLGGLTTPWGPFSIAIILGFFIEQFRFLMDWRLLIYGVIIVVVVLFRPDGLVTKQMIRYIEERAIVPLKSYFGERIRRDIMK